MFWFLIYFNFNIIKSKIYNSKINVKIMMNLEKKISCEKFHKLVLEKNNILLDIFFGILYTIHPIIPFISILFLNNLDDVKNYILIFGIINLSSVIIQLVFPLSPPWWNDKYKEKEASYNDKGDPGALIRIDKYFDINFFNNIYSTNPCVFGTFPSLHVIWPFLISFFNIDYRLKIISYLYTFFISLSAFYLRHHFIFDIILSLTTVFLFFSFIKSNGIFNI